MSDPLAEMVSLLGPQPTRSKMISGCGPWRVVRSEPGRAFYCALLEGACLLETDGDAPLRLEAGSFALIPLTGTFAMASAFAVGKQGINVMPILTAQGEARIGTPDGEPDVRMIVGHCTFASSDIELLTSLLPALVYVCGNERLSLFVRLLWEEWRADRPGRDVILQRLLEVLFIEALRCDGGVAARPGLIRGLADPGLARAMRRLHAAPTAPWTVVSLATIAGQSRSVFYERFKQAVGISPMRYLLDWRMTLARNMLRSERVGVAEVAHRVGYRSASTFTAAFTKRVGIPPTTFARNGCMTRGSGGGRQVQRAAAPRRARP